MTLAEEVVAQTPKLHGVPVLKTERLILRAPWQAEVIVFMVLGCGFYMMHGCLQVFASELTAEVRGTAMALHSFFFFLGQSIGPIFFGFGIFNIGKIPTVLTAAAIMVALGLTCARWLRQTTPADA